jgi:DNA-binding IclR family transcriptional regulator
LEIEPAHSYSVSAINAAVIDPSGEVVLIVSLMGFPGPLSGAEIEAAGDRLQSATAMVTAALAGNSA